MLARPDVTDIYINRPAEIWVETTLGSIERHDVPDLTAAVLSRLTRQVAAFSHQGISREHPLLSAVLPDGARIQAVIPPATRNNVALAIRKHVSTNLSLDDYLADGAFNQVRTGLCAGPVGRRRRDRHSLSRRRHCWRSSNSYSYEAQYLGVGRDIDRKTTFLNALIREIPAGERLITIEDTPELQIEHLNAIGLLLAVRGALGEAQINADDLVSASLRMRPDRIILGELRGLEAYAFLRAINTGHPGSITTIHADSPEGAIEQLILLVLQGGTKLGWQDVYNYIHGTIDLFVQLSRTSGRRYVSEVICRERASAAHPKPNDRL